jgi:hypothetical protein
MSVQQGPVGSVPAPRRGLPARPRLVLAVLGGLVLALIIAAAPLSVLARTWSASDAGPVADVTALCVVGAVIAWHRPANPLGWILLGAGGSDVLGLQLKWLLSGAAAGITLAVGGFLASITVPALNGIGSAASALGILALPVSLGLGILKFRLYDIDRIISRTLAYAIVTGLLVGVYAGLVLLATQVLTIKSPVAVAGSTLVAAALFNPLRHRVQRAVDRRFNRARYDADQTVAAFAGRLKDAVDLDSVRDDLASVVANALEPAHVSVWMSEHH